jgi:hypothetical protein
MVAVATTNNPDVDLTRAFGDAEIPYLEPYGCSRIPGMRYFPGTTLEDPQWRVDWFDTRDRIMVVREKIWAECERSLVRQAEERTLALSCPHYFKAIFGWIGEPRPRKGELAHKAFIPFHYQIHLTNYRLALVREEEERDAWCPKARGLGVSWNNQWDEIYEWLSRDCRWILSSRNEALVGDLNNPDAMFGKIFYGLRRIPEWLLPAGFDPNNPRKWWNNERMTLTNLDKNSPGYGAQLVGSPTTKNIGRAGRYTGADVDEAQKVPKLNAVIQSLRGSTFHILLTGTEGTQEGEDWYLGWTSAKVDNPDNVYELNYHQNAYQDPFWLERQYARATTPEQRADIALEYERNYFAGYGDWIYPEAHGIEALDDPYDPTKLCAVIFDPGKDDETAVLIAQPTLRKGQAGFHVLFTYEKKLTNMEWLCHVFTGIWPTPEDPCWGIQPTHEEREIGLFFSQRWLNGDPMFWGMDPAGINSQSNASFWSMFDEVTGRLRKREVQRMASSHQRARDLGDESKRRLPDPWGITLQYLALQRHRIQADRHYALRRYIPHITIQKGISSADRFKTCLTRYQYNPRSPRAVTEAVPLHNQYSHLSSTGEYLAIYIIYGFVDPAPNQKIQIRPTSEIGPQRGATRIPPALAHRLKAIPAPPPDKGIRMPAGARQGSWR